ncbi:methyl-accepting chemotaxis protein [Dongia rigui]|uniref:Methyl-accepting chemotaxis protein n=1 Tax=Dongia rigui TaxID=940149 RepID=A0ABU5DZW4_9PROT|nr:PAS domain-containing protein [Dongia rigui]MDY0872871.1 methyl-accepting chemotaxis protein [Dongia rigui]
MIDESQMGNVGSFDTQSAAGMGGVADERLAALLSITGRMDGFLYRCRNDPNYTMLYISEGILTVSGYPPSDFIGNKVRGYASITHPDDLAAVDAAVGKALETQTNWNIDYRIMPRQGEAIWVHEIGGGVFDAAGNLEFLEGFIIDISERKRLEQANRDLIDRIAVISEHIVKDTGNILEVLRALKMLALNARIEAARAGDMGLGFAVVAQEIKTLATTSGASAERITKLMNELQTVLATPTQGGH